MDWRRRQVPLKERVGIVVTRKRNDGAAHSGRSGMAADDPCGRRVSFQGRESNVMTAGADRQGCQSCVFILWSRLVEGYWPFGECGLGSAERPGDQVHAGGCAVSPNLCPMSWVRCILRIQRRRGRTKGVQGGDATRSRHRLFASQSPAALRQKVPDDVVLRIRIALAIMSDLLLRGTTRTVPLFRPITPVLPLMDQISASGSNDGVAFSSANRVRQSRAASRPGRADSVSDRARVVIGTAGEGVGRSGR